GTRFVGDRVVEWESEVLALVAAGRETRGPLGAGAEVDVVTAETPFYAESGGQVGDRGWLETRDGATRIEVLDTQRIAPTVVAHRGVVRQGAVSVGDRLRMRIDVARREAARLNHSATHLVQAALRRQLGPHVRQAGSLVRRTGAIGLFKVRGEAGVAAGVRRLEAVTGEGALDLVRRHEAVLREVATLLRGPEEEAAAKLEKLLAQQRDLEKRIAELQGKLAGGASRDVLADARRVDGVTVLATRVDGLDDKGLREMADRLRERIKSG